MSDLDALRTEISDLDRRLLELLNRRLELVAAVRDHKDEAGERWTTIGVSPNIIDASFQALMDSIVFKLVKAGAEA